MKTLTYRNYTIERKTDSFFMILNPLGACDAIVYSEHGITKEIDRLIREYGEWIKN